MSRLTKKPIIVPVGTEISVSGSRITVKGPLGVLEGFLDSRISLKIDKGEVFVSPLEPRGSQALLGSFVSHIKNMIAGVNKLFVKRLIIEGIGYKADVQGENLVLSLGFSHPVKMAVPQGVEVVLDKNGVGISGMSKEKVGQFAAKVRARRLPEPYKSKGIRYENEIIRKKQGKKTV